MNIKTFTTTIALVAALVGGAMAQTVQVNDGFNAKQEAVKAAISKMGEPVKSSKIGDKSVSIFFIEGDENGAIETYIRNVLVEAGKSVVVPNDDDNIFLKEIYKQMEFDERKTGILAPATIEKITDGTLKSTQVLVYGSCNIIEDNDRYTHAEISLDAFDIATKEYLFSKSADARSYKGTEEPAIKLSTLPMGARDVLQKEMFESIKKSVEASKKLKGVEKVVFVPLQPETDDDNAEIVEWDRYAEHVFVSAISQTAMTPVKSDATTIFDVRRQLIETENNLGDGLMWVALRGIDVGVKQISFLTYSYTVTIDVQGQIEKAGGREVVWSDSIMASASFTDTVSFWDWIFEGDLSKYGEADTLVPHVIRAVVCVIVGIVILVILGGLVRKMTRVR